jgi:CRISPR-associated protein Cas2
MFLLVAYDVPAERTEKYRKLLSRYLPQLQYSVFAGDMTEAVYKKLRRDIKDMYQDTDRLVFIQTANRRNICVKTLIEGVIQEDTSHLGSGIIA